MAQEHQQFEQERRPHSLYAEEEEVSFMTRSVNGQREFAVDKQVFFDACRRGDMFTIRRLTTKYEYDYPAQLRLANYEHSMPSAKLMTPFQVAAYNGQLKVIKFLFEEFPLDIDGKDEFRIPALHEAVSSGKLEIMKYLIDVCGADINVSGKVSLHSSLFSIVVSYAPFFS